MNTEGVAQICHEANRAYCEVILDDSQKPWHEATSWQRESAIRGVEYALDHPGASADAQHEAWRADKQANGWTYGPIKDAAIKEHPCMVPYCDLPIEQRLKDELFRSIVHAFAVVVVR